MCSSDLDIEVRSGDTIRISGSYEDAPKGGRIESVRIGVFQKGKWLKDWMLSDKIWHRSSEGNYFDVRINDPLSAGEYTLVFAINATGLPPTHNSRKIKLTVTQ